MTLDEILKLLVSRKPMTEREMAEEIGIDFNRDHSSIATKLEDSVEQAEDRWGDLNE